MSILNASIPSFNSNYGIMCVVEDDTNQLNEEDKNMSDNVKPQAGAYGKMTNEEYPESIKFEVNVPVVVTFPTTFKQPVELPNKDGDGVYYVFPVVVSGEERSLMTSAWTLLKKLKEREPIAGNTYIITKKLLGSKQEFFVDEEVDTPELA